MPSDARTRRLKTIEWLLVLGGVACVCWCVFLAARAWRYQSRELSRASRPFAASTPANSTRSSPVLPATLPIGEAIGRIDVPRLHLSAAVANGDDDGTLRLAIGHLPDTPFPWENGNSALAAHRDTFFRELRNIRVNDDIRVSTRYGDFAYQVTRTVVVMPDDLSVLEPTAQPTLTLVTCYPFSYVGHAPQRFIVQAVREVSGP